MGEKGPGEGQLSFDEPDNSSQPNQGENQGAEEKKPETLAQPEQEPGVEEIAWDKFNNRTFRSTGIEGNFTDHIKQLKKLTETQGENGISVKVERDRLEKIFLDTFREEAERGALLQKLQKELKVKEAALTEASEKYDSQDRGGPIYGNAFERARDEVEKYEAAIKFVEEQIQLEKDVILNTFNKGSVELAELIPFNLGSYDSATIKTLRQLSEYVSGQEPYRNPESSSRNFNELKSKLMTLLKTRFNSEQGKSLVLSLSNEVSQAVAVQRKILQEKEDGLEVDERQLKDAKLEYDKAIHLFDLIVSIFAPDSDR